jgi:hypothetical protein
MVMRRPVWTKEEPPPPLREKPALPAYSRDRLAVMLGIVTCICVGLAFMFARDPQFLMPGPLTSAHSAIGNCDACHTKTGSGKLSWTNGLVAGDPLSDSQACLGCHKMSDTAFHPHGASDEVLEQSNIRLSQVATRTRTPLSVRAQSAIFPADHKVARGVYCATCHQEHQGPGFNLKTISSEQCQSCHVVKFNRFDGHHPQFENYPFKRRSRIIYDHAGHFGKHFPEATKKGSRRVPSTCSTCHDSGKDKRIMAVAPFEQTCNACHLDQIVGKERVSGPKGIAFLTVPGLDLQTLKEKGAAIGEWPDGPEAEITPFMKVMIARNERGRALIRTVDRLNLQDLSGASDAEIEAVANLAWEVKRIFYALIRGKASDVLADLNISCGATLSPGLVTDLTASIPRDVVVRAHQQWLPNLGAEMANRPDTNGREQNCLISTTDGWVTTLKETRFGAAAEPADTPRTNRPAQADQTPTQTPAKNAPDAGAPKAAAALPEPAPAKAEPANTRPAEAAKAPDERPASRPADQTDDLLNPTEEELRATARPAVKGFTAQAGPDGGKVEFSSDEQPLAGIAYRKGAVQVAQAPKAADQTDDLLNPTEEERRGEAAPGKPAEKPAQPEAPAAKAETPRARPDSAAAVETPAKPEAPARPQAKASAEVPAAKAAPIISIESDVDPESWAEYGGWYRQDYTIFYRPTGHKDKFIYSWLVLTGAQSPKGEKSPAAAVFETLTTKEAQGSCTKCHSVDDIQGQGRLVNFSPASLANKRGRFTTFVHEPHFGILENRGCLTCHNLEKGRPYLQSYERGDPRNFASNFGAVKKELCQTCHTRSAARQDCLLCHKYHVNGVGTPVMNTKIPTE